MSKKIIRPNREPDHYSKRGVPYWFSPDWIRGTSADAVFSNPVREDLVPTIDGKFIDPCDNYGRIHPVKESSGDVQLYMKSKDGNLTFIQGSIQKEFKKWHEDRSIDYLLLGMDPDEIIATGD